VFAFTEAAVLKLVNPGGGTEGGVEPFRGTCSVVHGDCPASFEAATCTVAERCCQSEGIFCNSSSAKMKEVNSSTPTYRLNSWL